MTTRTARSRRRALRRRQPDLLGALDMTLRRLGVDLALEQALSAELGRRLGLGPDEIEGVRNGIRGALLRAHGFPGRRDPLSYRRHDA